MKVISKALKLEGQRKHKKKTYERLFRQVLRHHTEVCHGSMISMIWNLTYLGKVLTFVIYH
jgi:hypothetical protein